MENLHREVFIDRRNAYVTGLNRVYAATLEKDKLAAYLLG
jgi:hypothetical protein